MKSFVFHAIDFIYLDLQRQNALVFKTKVQ